MQTIEENKELVLLGLMAAIALVFTIVMKSRNTSNRLRKLESRSLIDIADLCKLIGSETKFDIEKMSVELTLLAKALEIPVGKLRPDDFVEDLVGKDFYAGDALLEIEARLQSSYVNMTKTTKLSVAEVVRGLVK
jgi:hypothetical protein